MNRNNKNKKIKFEILSQELIARDRESLLTRVTKMTELAWGDPSDLANKWIELASFMAIARNESSKDIGFIIAHDLSKGVIVLVASMVVFNNQEQGVGKLLAFKAIKKYYTHAIWHLNLNRLFSPLYVVFRTPNPQLYYSVYKRLDTFPSPGRNAATDREKQIFDLVVQKFGSGKGLDRDNFIIFGAYSQYPDLIYSKEKIPWCHDVQINNFLDRKLKLSSSEGNTMVIVCRVNFMNVLRYLFNSF